LEGINTYQMIGQSMTAGRAPFQLPFMRAIAQTAPREVV